MDIKDIDDLMTKMEKKNMKRLVIKKEGIELELERAVACGAIPAPVAVAAAPVVEAAAPVATAKPAGKAVKSPIVGTFYASPSPEDPAFVKVGDQVESESVVCIVEAMKVMNEVKAGVQGKVVEVLVKNGDPVEFGTEIFRVE